MSGTDVLRQILAGGLPAVLDGGTSSTAQGDRRVERTAPEPTNKDVIPGFRLGSITQSQILMITAGVLAVLGAVYLFRR